MTYPQEGPIDQVAFESYFFAADVFVAILGAQSEESQTEARGPVESPLEIQDAAAGRSWEECVMGMYYVCFLDNSATNLRKVLTLLPD